jgi:hypothetical protein
MTPCSLPTAHLNHELQAWERTYQTLRPHQAMAYLNPQGFLAQASPQRKQLQCH